MKDGELHFVEGKGKGSELLHIRFHREGDNIQMGQYTLESRNWGPYRLRCVSTKGQENGWDIMRKAYEGADLAVRAWKS